MKRFINYVVSNFGFDNTTDFLNSFIHTNLLAITIPFATLSTLVSHYFGMEITTAFAFTVLIFLELITGMVASKVKKIKIESRKFGRFGLKLLVWFSFFFIIHSLKMQYSASNKIVYHVYDWLHDGLMIYVSLEYVISVLENMSAITGKNYSGVINKIKDKIDKTLK